MACLFSTSCLSSAKNLCGAGAGKGYGEFDDFSDKLRDSKENPWKGDGR